MDYYHPTPASLYKTFDLYNACNEKLKHIMSKRFHISLLEKDILEIGTLHGHQGCGTAGYTEYLEFMSLKRLKDIAKYNVRYYERNITEYTYKELENISEEEHEVVLVIWHSPREGDDFISGFYELNLT